MMEARYRLASGVRVLSEGGRLRVLRRGDELALPASLCTPLLQALLGAFSLPSTAAEVGQRVGADVVALLPVLERLDVIEALVPDNTRVQIVGDLETLCPRLAEEGFLPCADGPRLVVWDGSGAPPSADVPVLQCAPWIGGVGAIGPLGPCPRCWRGRLAAHGGAHAEPFGALARSERIMFTELVVREAVAVVLDHPQRLRPGAWRALDHASGALTIHTFLGLDGCPHCCGHGGLTDARSGIFASVDVEPLESRRVPLFVGVGRLGDPRALGRGDGSRGSAGVSSTAAGARGKAVGEGLERYCASVPAPFDAPPTPWRALGRAGLDPTLLALYSEAQYRTPGFPYVRPSRDLPLRWIEGSALPSREPLAVPAACVYMPYEVDEAPLLPAHSHGLGCGATLEDAVRAGLLELVERDAFMRFWQRGEAAPRLGGTDRLGGVVRGLLDEAEERGWEVDLLCLDGAAAISAVLAVARPQARDGPRLVVGAAADVAVGRALERAMLEVFQNYRWLAREVPRRHAADKVETFEDHALYYSLHLEAVARLAFLGAGPIIDLAEVPPVDGTLDERLAACGFEGAFVDLTSPDVRTAGFHVARAIVPALVRVHAEETLPFLGSPRLGGRSNPLPHPFP